RHSLRCILLRVVANKARAFSRRENAEVCVISPSHCELSEAIQLLISRRDGLLRGACHRARIRATRWLAMTNVTSPRLRGEVGDGAKQSLRLRATRGSERAINKMTARGGQILLVAIDLLAFF